MKTLNINLGDRSYPIYIGQSLLSDKEIFHRHVKSKTIAIVTNDIVAPLYLNILIEMLGKDKNLLVVKSDEINQKSKKYVRYETDIRLLKRLLMGPRYAHWNNAEIGSHLKFFRKPNTFERDIYGSMVSFHC